MPARQGAFHDHIVGQAPGAAGALQEQLEGAHRRDDDAELGVAEARVRLDEREGAEVKTRTQGDPVDTTVHSRLQPHLQGGGGVVHGQLLHAVHEDRPLAPLGLHGGGHMHALRLRQLVQVEVDHGLVRACDIGLVLLQLALHVACVVGPIGHGGHHRVGDVAHTAQTGRLQGEGPGGDVHAHATDDDRDILASAQPEAEFIQAFHDASRGMHAGHPAMGRTRWSGLAAAARFRPLRQDLMPRSPGVCRGTAAAARGREESPPRATRPRQGTILAGVRSSSLKYRMRPA